MKLLNLLTIGCAKPIKRRLKLAKAAHGIYRSYCHQFPEALLTVLTDDRLLMEFPDFAVKGFCARNLADTMVEVFVCDMYQVDDSADRVVFDIGFNMGIAALYFARMPNVRKVHAFEPLEAARCQGLENLKLNPRLAAKIQVEPYGLAGSERRETIRFDPGSTTNASVYQSCCGGSSEVIDLKQASAVLAPLIHQYKGECRIHLKIDCEGAEHEIIPDLARAGLLACIDVLVLEWHFKDPDEILRLLQESGFSCRQQSFGPALGLIRAARSVASI